MSLKKSRDTWIFHDTARAWLGALFVSFKFWLPYIFWVIFLCKKHFRSVLCCVLQERFRKVKGRVKAVPWCWEVLWRLANAATFSTKYVLTEEVFFNRSRIFLLKENRLLAGERDNLNKIFWGICRLWRLAFFFQDYPCSSKGQKCFEFGTVSTLWI